MKGALPFENELSDDFHLRILQRVLSFEDNITDVSQL